MLPWEEFKEWNIVFVSTQTDSNNNIVGRAIWEIKELSNAYIDADDL